jgi:hypothetical protein
MNCDNDRDKHGPSPDGTVITLADESCAAPVDGTDSRQRDDELDEAQPLNSDQAAEIEQRNAEQIQTQIDSIQFNSDYEKDENYGLIWNYLCTGSLTGDKCIDYRTTLLCDQYLIENNRLYRICLPKSRKRLQFAGESRKILVIPKANEHHILVHMHALYGHYSGAKLFDIA